MDTAVGHGALDGLESPRTEEALGETPTWHCDGMASIIPFPPRLRGSALNVITDTDVYVLGIEKGQADNRLAATAGMVIAILRALADIVSAESVDNMNCRREDMTLSQLAMGIREHDGIIGISFEHAIHYGIANKMPPMYDYVCAALRNMFEWEWPIESVLFGIEKRKYDHFLSRIEGLLGEEPSLVTKRNCAPGMPLTRELFVSLRKLEERRKLPEDLRGLIKTDLFFGSRERQLWTSVSIKYNPIVEENWPGIGLAIYPYEEKNEKAAIEFMLRKTWMETAQLPIPHKSRFMEHFHSAYNVVEKLVETRFSRPKARFVHNSVRWLVDFLCNRRQDRIIDVEEDLTKQVGTTDSTSVYLPGKSGWITNPEEVRNLLPNDLKQDLLFSALPLYRESPWLDAILNQR